MGAIRSCRGGVRGKATNAFYRRLGSRVNYRETLSGELYRLTNVGDDMGESRDSPNGVRHKGSTGAVLYMRRQVYTHLGQGLPVYYIGTWNWRY
jgi:hypothetical protein